MRLAEISHGRDGYTLVIERVPWWAYTIESAWFLGVCPATGHLLCGPRDWMYAIGFGADPEPDPDLRLGHRWSLGHGAFAVSQYMGALTHRHTATVVKIPVTREFVHLNFPENAVDWDSEDPDLSPDAARWAPGEPGH